MKCTASRPQLARAKAARGLTSPRSFRNFRSRDGVSDRKMTPSGGSSSGIIHRMKKRTSSMLYDASSEVKRLTWSDSVRVSVLLREEVGRVRAEKRHLIFPEAPGIWDTFWIGLLFIFVMSVVPGLFYFCSRQFPYHWKPLNQSMVHDGVDLQLYETAGYGVVTPLQKPMHSFFILHVLSAFLASALLLILFTTGRVMRWRLADGTVNYDSADDLHRIFAFWSSLLWTVIIVTGTFTIPLLHPTLQMANYAEMAGVLTMFVGALMSAYNRQWVLHRLCAWGLIYSATASVFVGLSGRLLQAWTGMSAYEVKAIGYTVAFSTPVVGLARDIFQETRKLTQDNSQVIRSLAQERYQQGVKSQRLIFVKQIKPFKGARTDKMRRLSLFHHIAAREPEEEFVRRRSTAIANESKLKVSRRTLAHLNELYESASSKREVSERLVEGTSWRRRVENSSQKTWRRSLPEVDEVPSQSTMNENLRKTVHWPTELDLPLTSEKEDLPHLETNKALSRDKLGPFHLETDEFLTKEKEDTLSNCGLTSADAPLLKSCTEDGDQFIPNERVQEAFKTQKLKLFKELKPFGARRDRIHLLSLFQRMADRKRKNLQKSRTRSLSDSDRLQLHASQH